MSKLFYITTAIDYVNGQPHLGHAYEKVMADGIARAERSLGKEVFLLTGLDEHGQKVQRTAQEQGLPAQAYCDALAADWKNFAGELKLSNTDFIRTTEPRHKAVVQAILSKLHADGFFYRSKYSGYYSTRQETFLTEKDRRPDGTFDPIYGEVTHLVEDNYYFKLAEQQDWLIDYIERNPDFIYPSYRRNEALGILKNSKLEDLCSTRPRARLEWGIPVPFDPEYVTYVWFDALVNYLTIPAVYGDPVVVEALGLANNPEITSQATFGQKLSLWPADIHVVGKDILKFHTIFWPIMLKAMGLPLPKQIVLHGFWEKDGQKISKTTGNIVDPIGIIREWGLDAFRFYVTRELDIGPDGNWTNAGFESRYQAELANGLGNLINRSLSMLKRYRNGEVPAPHDELRRETEEYIAKTQEALRTHKLQEALQTIWLLVGRANQYVDQTAPFKLAKDPAQASRLDEVLYNLVEVCRVLGTLLRPLLPDTAERILSQLAISAPPGTLLNLGWGGLPQGHKIGDPQPLFPRKDQKPPK
jgi:methionyl-tRNA synthetase